MFHGFEMVLSDAKSCFFSFIKKMYVIHGYQQVVHNVMQYIFARLHKEVKIARVYSAQSQ